MTAGLNGKTGEMLRWLIGLALAAITSYFTAQGALKEKLAVVDTREQTRWEEVQRRLGSIEASTQRNEELFRAVLRDWTNGVDRRTGEPLPLQSQIDRRK